MALPAGFLDELRSRLPLSQVVGRQVRLIRGTRGESKGLCPFHNEKTPSFTVSDDKGFFHCFGCGAHGDVVAFLMQSERLGFMEAVERLAAEAGMEMPRRSAEEAAEQSRARTLLDALGAAAAWFEAQLRGSAGQAARDYLAGRGLDGEAAARFRLGFAPADGRALLAALGTQGFAPELLIEAGVARAGEEARPPYSFFRSRIVFPVGDRQGRTVGFGGRLMAGDGPKYINGPDTAVFHKGRLLYGLHRARQAAAEGGRVIVCEGYMDVIALVRAGFEGAVAPLGTALTEQQIAEAWKLAATPVLCFDGDAAGTRAAARAAARILPLLRPDHSFEVAFLPAGEDPDSLIRAEGAAAMTRVLETALPLAEILWRSALAEHRLDSPEGRAGLQAALEAQYRGIEDRAVRAFYLSDLRQRLDAAFRPQRPAFVPGARRPAAQTGALPLAGPKPSRPQGVEQQPGVVLLALLINHPSLADTLGEQLSDWPLTDPRLVALRQTVSGALAADSALDSAGLARQLIEAGFGPELARILTKRLYSRAPFLRPTATPEQARDGWRDMERHLALRRMQRDVREAGASLAEDWSETSKARLMALHREVAAVSASDDPAAAEPTSPAPERQTM